MGKKRNGPQIKYLAVVEFQERGAVHYHMIANLPFLPEGELADLWSHGFVKINAINHVDNLGAYVIKYMSSDLDDDRLDGRKAYFRSRNLDEPREFTDVEKVSDILANLPGEPVYESSCKNEYIGEVTYKQYNRLRE